MDYSFKLSEEILYVLCNYTLTADTQLELLTVAIDEVCSEQDFEYMLKPYRTDSLSSILTDTIHLGDDGLSINSDWKGEAFIVFKDERVAGCSNIGGISDCEADISFSINPQSGTITFYAMEEQEREMDEI